MDLEFLGPFVQDPGSAGAFVAGPRMVEPVGTSCPRQPTRSRPLDRTPWVEPERVVTGPKLAWGGLAHGLVAAQVWSLRRCEKPGSSRGCLRLPVAWAERCRRDRNVVKSGVQ